MPLPYNFQITDEYTYTFVTDMNVRYTAYFILADNLKEDYPHLYDKVYVFGFDRESTEENIKFDPRVRSTIEEILRLFFNSVENVILYTCDTADGKHRGRKILFNRWYHESGVQYDLVKIDAESKSDTDIYYTSIILKEGNPFRGAFEKAIQVENDIITSGK